MEKIKQSQHAEYMPEESELKAFPLRWGKRQVCPFSPVLAALATAVRQEKEIKGIKIGTENIELSGFPGDMILYVENLKDSTKRNFLICENK